MVQQNLNAGRNLENLAAALFNLFATRGRLATLAGRYMRLPSLLLE